MTQTPTDSATSPAAPFDQRDDRLVVPDLQKYFPIRRGPLPTPVGALQGLAKLAPLEPNARILDAGCGLGDGLRELRGEYPACALHGPAWSWPLRFACAWRCRVGGVSPPVGRADTWAAAGAAGEGSPVI